MSSSDPDELTIAVSIMVHESNECITDLIQNINQLIRNPIIILHVNPDFATFASPQGFNNIIINPHRYQYKAYDSACPGHQRDTMIGHQISNFDYLLRTGHVFDYFLVLPSNCLLVKSGIEEYIRQFDVGFLNTRRYYEYAYRAEANPRTKKVRERFPSLGPMRYVSNIDGSYYKCEVFKQLAEMCRDIYDPNERSWNYEEEYILPLLIDHLPSLKCSTTICYMDIDKDALTIDEVQEVIDGIYKNNAIHFHRPNNIFFAVKRIPRKYDDPVRIFIRRYLENKYCNTISK